MQNFYSGQNGEAPQLSRIDQSTTLISLTAGGNDVDFRGALTFCIAAPVCAPGEDLPTRYKISQTLPRLRTLYSDILDKAPNAQVYVLGYPRFFSKSPGYLCNGIERDEATWMNNIVDRLDGGIRDQIRSIGNARLHYVDVASAFDGGELCSGPTPVYMNGLIKANLVYSFHPTAGGQAMLALRLVHAYRG